jgi:hypothetical protein
MTAFLREQNNLNLEFLSREELLNFFRKFILPKPHRCRNANEQQQQSGSNRSELTESSVDSIVDSFARMNLRGKRKHEEIQCEDENPENEAKKRNDKSQN